MNYEQYFGQNYGIGTTSTKVTPNEDWSNYFKEQIKPGGMPIQKMYSDSPVMVEGIQASRHMDVGPVEVIRPTHEQMMNNYAQRNAEQRMIEEQKRYYQSWQERVEDMVKHPEEEEPVAHEESVYEQPVEEPVVDEAAVNKQVVEEQPDAVQNEQQTEEPLEVVPADNLTEIPDESILIDEPATDDQAVDESGVVTTPDEAEIISPDDEAEQIDGVYIINSSEVNGVSASDNPIPTDVTSAEVSEKFSEPSVVLPNIPELKKEPALEPGGLDITDMEVNVNFDDDSDGLFFEDEETPDAPPSESEYTRTDDDPIDESAEISGLLPDEEPQKKPTRGRPAKKKAEDPKTAKKTKASAKKTEKKTTKKTTKK